MKVAVCIPWRPSPSRIKPYERVRRYWDEHFPDWPVITADAGGEIFNLGASRNAAVRQAETQVVVLCDADTCPPVDSVRIAVENPSGIIWPHKVWKLIPAECVDGGLDDFARAPGLVEYSDGLGGCIVATAEEYWRIGGMPEEFRDGWGHEDKAFMCVARTLSQFRRIGGTAYSIEHNQKLRFADSPGWDRASMRNQKKYHPYEVADGKPELMWEWLKMRYEPPLSGDWRSRAGIYLDPIRRELIQPPKRQTSQTRDWRERWINQS